MTQQPVYYTTSHVQTWTAWLNIEVIERENYTFDEIQEWDRKYDLRGFTNVIWVTKLPWIAARYTLPSQMWDEAEKIYKSNPNNFDIKEIKFTEGILIEESDDGDGGFLFKYTDNFDGEIRIQIQDLLNIITEESNKETPDDTKIDHCMELIEKLKSNIK